MPGQPAELTLVGESIDEQGRTVFHFDTSDPLMKLSIVAVPEDEQAAWVSRFAAACAEHLSPPESFAAD